MQAHLKAVSLAVATLVAGSFGAVGSAAAQSSTEAASTALSTVTVQGTRTRSLGAGALGARSELETPFSVRQVDAEDLDARQVKSLGKVFANDASVMSLGDTYSFNAYSINVRGIPLDDYNG